MMLEEDTLIDRINDFTRHTNLTVQSQKITDDGTHVQISLDLIGEIAEREQSAEIEIIIRYLVTMNGFIQNKSMIKNVEPIKRINKKQKNPAKFNMYVFLKLSTSLPLTPRHHTKLNSNKIRTHNFIDKIDKFFVSNEINVPPENMTTARRIICKNCDMLAWKCNGDPNLIHAELNLTCNEHIMKDILE